jgi:hypothetical protein
MSEAGPPVLVAAFRGPVSVRGAPFLTISGTTPDGDPLEAIFNTPVPADLPAMLESACIERVSSGQCIRAAGRVWPIAAITVHLHYGVPSFYTAIVPRVPPWHRRLLFGLLVGLAARPAGRALLRRLRG